MPFSSLALDKMEPRLRRVMTGEARLQEAFRLRASHPRKHLVEQYLELMAAEERLPVVVRWLGPEISTGDEGQARSPLDPRPPGSPPVTVPGSSLKALSLIGGLAISVTREELERLCEVPEVARVWFDAPVVACLDVARAATRAPEAWEQSHRGQGVTVAVVDTGIHPHPDLVTPENRIVAFADMVNGRTDPYDDNGHGTHVAGIIAGGGVKDPGFMGIAPAAALAGVRVLNAQGSALLSTVVRGLQWTVANREKHGIRVINMSLGGAPGDSYADDPLCQAVEACWDAGIAVITAAGNSGPHGRMIDSPGLDPKVVTVGAMDDRGTIGRADDILAAFSSRGPTADGFFKPDLTAPGVNIVSLRAPDSTLDLGMPYARQGDWYFRLSGTSMATPMVAGAAALLLAANPSLTPDQVKARLRDGAEDRGQPVVDGGAGYLDLRGSFNPLPEVAFGSRQLVLAGPNLAGTNLAGTDVRILQWRLGDEGFLGPTPPGAARIPASGRFDQATSNALRRFQRYYGLAATGYTTDATYWALGARSGAFTGGQPVFGARPLGLGAHGQDVRELQNRLALAGVPGARPATGAFDQATAGAVRAFQLAVGCEPATGTAGQPTALALARHTGMGARNLSRWPYGNQMGTRGCDVRQAQRRLKAERLNPGPIDGYFGPKTYTAVRLYQRAHRLRDDGMVTEEDFWSFGRQ